MAASKIHTYEKSRFSSPVSVVCFFLAILLMISLIRPFPSMATQDSAESQGPQNDPFYVDELLGLILSDKTDISAVETLVKKQQSMDEKDHRWPVITFLLGEFFFKNNDYSAAHYFYESLIQWSIDESNHLSALFVLGIYRDLVIRTSENGKEIQSLGLYPPSMFLTIVRSHLKTEPVQNVFKFYFHSALPKIQEKILLFSTRLAWHSNFEKSKLVSKSFLLDYLLLAAVSELNEGDADIKNELLQEISVDRLNLSVAIHLKKLKNFSEAEALLSALYEKSDKTEIRALAAVHLSEVIRNTHELSGDKNVAARSKKKRLELLDFVKKFSNDAKLIQKAFLLAAKGRGSLEYEQEHVALIKNYPKGTFTDRAYSNLGRHYWYTAKLMGAGLYEPEPGSLLSGSKDAFFQKSLDTYETLQKFKYDNNWQETSFFIPAFMMYSQATSEIPHDKKKIQKAIALLEKGLDGKDRIFKFLEYHAMFWLGRMYEELDSPKSKQYFTTLTEKSPYLYYGIRAQMHLRLGKKAKYNIFASPADMNLWKKRYDRSKSEKNIFKGKSQYFKRVDELISSGLYVKLVNLENSVVAEAGQRIGDLSLENLDKNANLTQIMLLISARLDAIKAALKAGTVHDRIEIGRKFSKIDPFMALRIVNVRLHTAQNEDNFLSTIYPEIYSEQLRSASRDKEHVYPELLYSVMRHESFFSPSAISINNALGLYQFIPSTFDMLNAKFNLTKVDEEYFREKYLFNPDNSIQLAAKWFASLLKINDNNMFWSLANHNAGTTKVKEWKSLLQAENKEKDIEYALESINYPQTRKFLREIMANLILTKSFAWFSPEGEE